MKERGKVILFFLLLVIFLTVVFLGLFITRTSSKPTKKGTVLTITPSSFYGGHTTHVFTAKLMDADGNPLAGKTIVWSASPRILSSWVPDGVETLLSPVETVTDSMGQASITYWAPTVDFEIPQWIIAEFAGDEFYEGSRGISEGTIVPGSMPPPPPP